MLRAGIKENDIFVCQSEIEKKVGKICYIFDGKQKRYFPDIYIESQNRILEVKSMYTMNCDTEKNEKKKEACLKLGLNFNFLVLDSKGLKADFI